MMQCSACAARRPANTPTERHGDRTQTGRDYRPTSVIAKSCGLAPTLPLAGRIDVTRQAVSSNPSLSSGRRVIPGELIAECGQQRAYEQEPSRAFPTPGEPRNAPGTCRHPYAWRGDNLFATRPVGRLMWKAQVSVETSALPHQPPKRMTLFVLGS
jgi:hypothetical protein